MSIEFKDVGYAYFKRTPFEKKVLHDINFKIDTGNFISIIGHTGSGKSTLIQLMNLLLSGFEGDIIIDSLNVKNKKVNKAEIRKKFGFSFQYPEYQFFEDTIYKDIAFSLKIRGENEELIENKIRRAMDMVCLNFDKYKDKNPFDISGGEKRKLSLASILVLDPSYIILDEPTVGLDPKSCEEVELIIKNLNKQFNKTIIMVTHIMDLVFGMSDKVMLLDNGKIVRFDYPYDIFTDENLCNKYHIEKPYLVKLFLELRKNGIDIKECPRDIENMEKLIYNYLYKRSK
ncbi:ATPase component of general energizing module of ECF transporters [Candidatus Arthromitus sp. SFB-mouse-NL]|uniref:ATP-binding cassette domain-containing protein n=1 Tax=Candidatus Arthromitus sp. SFB-mouse-NL TaxID=1508644 RepID=UPI000499F788|nr:ATP-binding cassette domain-containing protein [Candidatus Arthromitus sp. SFB-mouse-NL]AID45336.1 ATPase component of general energizing module of ECF transporters [Candidatus Arthromitus sp. SFB-mouse-NL]